MIKHYQRKLINIYILYFGTEVPRAVSDSDTDTWGKAKRVALPTRRHHHVLVGPGAPSSGARVVRAATNQPQAGGRRHAGPGACAGTGPRDGVLVG